MSAQSMHRVRELAIDQLDREIVSLSARINAATYELLVLIRQFDERAGWLKWGLSSCAEWLHWRCDLSMSAAREKVRVAHALKTLSEVSAAFATGSLSYSKVRALTRVARADNEASPPVASDNYQVMVHVDQSALASGQGRSGLPIETVKRLCCDGSTVAIVQDEQGEPLSIGRKSRVVPTAIKRALQARDRGCVFPGCQNRRFVDAHHIKHWSAGGETSLDNLMLLCSRHHRLVHEGGFRIERDYRNRWFFREPDGRAVPSCGYRPDYGSDYESDNSIDNPSAEGFAGESRSDTPNGFPSAPARATCLPGIGATSREYRNVDVSSS